MIERIAARHWIAAVRWVYRAEPGDPCPSHVLQADGADPSEVWAALAAEAALVRTAWGAISFRIPALPPSANRMHRVNITSRPSSPAFK